MFQRIEAFRGTKLRCKGWRQEALLRMLENNLENAERPEELIVYAGAAKAARNWECYRKIVDTLKNLEEDETLLMQSGKPIVVFKTHRNAPKVLMANNNIVVSEGDPWMIGKNKEEIRQELEERELTVFPGYTAAPWQYIGTQGIIQGTYETFAMAAKKFGGTLKGRLVLSGGLGGMGGAQPLAVTMNEGVCIVVEVDRKKIERRIQTGFCDQLAENLSEALKIATEALKKGEAIGIGLLGNAAEIHPELLRRGLIPDIVTDQTSAHHPLHYVPVGLSVESAEELRKKNPEEYIRRSLDSMATHVSAMLGFQEKGADVFEYGNFIRRHAFLAGIKNAYGFDGFSKKYIRTLLCEGIGPFRWIALSGNPQDIHKIDQVVLQAFGDDERITRWIHLAGKIKYQGLPARICWLGCEGRRRLGRLINRMVSKNELEAPVSFTRDHIDQSAQPTRETEGMKDWSDAIADWPILNALLNASSGADLVTINSGGMYAGYVSSGVTIVATGTEEAEERLERVLFLDPALCVVRHADAGYPSSIEMVKYHKMKTPMI